MTRFPAATFMYFALGSGKEPVVVFYLRGRGELDVGSSAVQNKPVYPPAAVKRAQPAAPVRENVLNEDKDAVRQSKQLK